MQTKPTRASSSRMRSSLPPPGPGSWRYTAFPRHGFAIQGGTQTHLRGTCTAQTLPINLIGFGGAASDLVNTPNVIQDVFVDDPPPTTIMGQTTDDRTVMSLNLSQLLDTDRDCIPDVEELNYGADDGFDDSIGAVDEDPQVLMFTRNPAGCVDPKEVDNQKWGATGGAARDLAKSWLATAAATLPCFIRTFPEDVGLPGPPNVPPIPKALKRACAIAEGQALLGAAAATGLSWGYDALAKDRRIRTTNRSCRFQAGPHSS